MRNGDDRGEVLRDLTVVTARVSRSRNLWEKHELDYRLADVSVSGLARQEAESLGCGVYGIGSSEFSVMINGMMGGWVVTGEEARAVVLDRSGTETDVNAELGSVEKYSVQLGFDVLSTRVVTRGVWGEGSKWFE